MRQPGPARGVLRGPSSEHERVVPVDPALGEHVAHWWWVAWDVGRSTVTETLPHPAVHVIVEGRAPARVHGVATGMFRRRLPPRGRVFGVKFRPAAFHAWFGGRALATIADRSVPIEEVFGAAGAAYARAIRAERTAAGCRAIAEAFFAPRVPALPPETRLLRDLVERLERDPSIVRIEQAAAIVGLSPRTLQRRFLARVGVSPKWVIQRYRLHEAAALLAQGRRSLAQIAAAVGYFDQAHFARDFRAVVGAPPSAYQAAARG